MEVELKLLLTERAYHQVLAECPATKPPVEQENIFFDSEDRRLRAIRWALRLRIENDGFYLTAKGPAETSNLGLYSRPEFESALSGQEAAALRGGFRLSAADRGVCRPIMERVGDIWVSEIFRFFNTRTRAQHGSLRLEVDKTRIGEETHYELEVEVPAEDAGAATEAIQGWFAQRGWDYRPSPVSKLARAEEYSCRNSDK